MRTCGNVFPSEERISHRGFSRPWRRCPVVFAVYDGRTVRQNAKRAL